MFGALLLALLAPFSANALDACAAPPSVCSVTQKSPVPNGSVCGIHGKVNIPAPVAPLCQASSFANCRDACLGYQGSPTCMSFLYNSQDGTCRLYGVPVKQMAPQQNNALPNAFWDAVCFTGGALKNSFQLFLSSPTDGFEKYASTTLNDTGQKIFTLGDTTPASGKKFFIDASNRLGVVGGEGFVWADLPNTTRMLIGNPSDSNKLLTASLVSYGPTPTLSIVVAATYTKIIPDQFHTPVNFYVQTNSGSNSFYFNALCP